MSHFLVLIMAIFIDRLFGEPVKFQPLQGFAKIANFIEKSWFGQEESMIAKDSKGSQLIELLVKFKGTLAMLFLVLPFLVLNLFIDQFAPFNFIFDIFVLYLAIGAHSLKEHTLNVHKFLSANDIEQARKELAALTDRETSDMGPQQILLACLQSVLKNSNNAIFAPVFWFVLFGAPGAVLYRLVNMLAGMWDYRKPRYRNFGVAAHNLDTILSFIPTYLTAISYILVGQLKLGWQCLQRKGMKWDPAMAAGVGALNIEMSDAEYEGQVRSEPSSGFGQAAQLKDIGRACAMVDRSMILWLAIIFMVSLSHC